MDKITSVSGIITLPEIKINFVLHLGEKDPEEELKEGIGVRTMSKILDKASNLPQELQEIIAEFADYLAKKKEQN